MDNTVGMSNCLQRIDCSDKCGTHLDAQREWGSSLPPMYETPIRIWISHTHIWGNKRTIVHTLANERDLSELLFQHCQVVSQGTWCKCSKTCPRFTVSKGGLVTEDGVLVLWWGKHLCLLPPHLNMYFTSSEHSLGPVGPKLCVYNGLRH